MKLLSALPSFDGSLISAVRPYFIPGVSPHAPDDGEVAPVAGSFSIFSIGVVLGTSGADILMGRTPPDLDDLGTDTRDLIIGFSGDDTIFGMGGLDTLIGGAGNDVIRTGAADGTILDFLGDLILAGAGNDDVRGSVGDDTIFGGAGHDLIWGDVYPDINVPGGSDRIYGGGGNDTLIGNVGNDTLRGQSGHDWLNGGSDDDLLAGGKGNDTLAGGRGDDVLVGGKGVDSFLYFEPSISLGGGHSHNGNDVIRDFGPEDRLLTAVALDDPDGDGLIPLLPGGIVDLPAGVWRNVPDGTVTLEGASDADVLVFVGRETVGNSDYNVYELL